MNYQTKNAPAEYNRNYPGSQLFFNRKSGAGIPGVVQKKEALFFNPNPGNPFFKKAIDPKDTSPVQAKTETSQASLNAASPGTGSRTGIPEPLKSKAEALSGIDMSDVTVQYASPEPAGIGALAYAQGNEIHVSAGEEKHLSHEVWHVVQQKQGRVSPTGVQAKGVAVNNDAGLETEADQMGEKMSAGNLPAQTVLNTFPVSRSIVQQKVIQKKQVSTNFGRFETTQFAEAGGRGVEIALVFHPDKAKVDAKKIALSQSVRSTLANGNTYAIDPSKNKRMVPGGKTGAGYTTDRLSNKNNPIYGAEDLAATETLKDTKDSNGATGDALGFTKTYQLGQCYKVNPADADKTALPEAGLFDQPLSGGKKGESKMFETTALAIEGADINKYYGSVKWGYKMEGTDAAPTVTKTDIEIASMGTPTANFLEPAKLWNAAKTRGTIKVTADPEANGLNGAGTAAEKIAKDTKLKQLDTVMWNADPAIRAEVLRADGTGSGKIVHIKNADVTDAGDGSAHKELPVVYVKVATAQITEAVHPQSPLFTPSQQPLSPPALRTIPANTRMELIFGGSSDKLPQVRVLEGIFTGNIITISLEDSLKLKDE